jgi:predicted LPLAT superfamily acyltransferase
MIRFDAVIGGVGTRLLSERTFDLVLAPALADYQVERRTRSGRDWLNRFAVLLALSGALRMEAASHAVSFVTLALLPFAYDVVLLTLFSDFFDMDGGWRFVGAMVVALSMVPVVVCFWPTGRLARSID